MGLCGEVLESSRSLLVYSFLAAHSFATPTRLLILFLDVLTKYFYTACTHFIFPFIVCVNWVWFCTYFSEVHGGQFT